MKGKILFAIAVILIVASAGCIAFGATATDAAVRDSLALQAKRLAGVSAISFVFAVAAKEK